MDVDTGQFQAVTDAVASLAGQVGDLSARVEELEKYPLFVNAMTMISQATGNPGLMRYARRAHLRLIGIREEES